MSKNTSHVPRPTALVSSNLYARKSSALLFFHLTIFPLICLNGRCIDAQWSTNTGRWMMWGLPIDKICSGRQSGLLLIENARAVHIDGIRLID